MTAEIIKTFVKFYIKKIKILLTSRGKIVCRLKNRVQFMLPAPGLIYLRFESFRTFSLCQILSTTSGKCRSCSLMGRTEVPDTSARWPIRQVAHSTLAEQASLPWLLPVRKISQPGWLHKHLGLNRTPQHEHEGLVLLLNKGLKWRLSRVP